MDKTTRFGMKISPRTKELLQELAWRNRLSSSALVRRLIRQEAERHGLVKPVTNEARSEDED